MSFLLTNLLHFSRLLHALGADVQAGRMLDVADALQYVDIGRRSDFCFTLRSLLVHRQQDLAIFDEAFNAFWRRPPDRWTSEDLRAMGEKRRFDKPRVDIPPAEPDSPNRSSMPGRDEKTERITPLSYSAREISRAKDFAQFTEDELKRAEAAIAALNWNLGARQTRRWTGERGRLLDFKKLLRRNVRYGGEPIEFPKRERRSKPRPLVVLCDVSGSMERYTRMLLLFVGSLAGGLEHVEAFVFATRLTRITRDLPRPGRESFPTLPRQVPDWAGGTRIGDALRAFNMEWARRVMGHGPVVLLISDGWDRGDPEVLKREMSRLQRSCHRLIWLNPLLGSPDYRPLTRGMQAALPFVDDFLPVHNLASLEMLAAHLSELPARRGSRARPRTGAA